MTSSAVPPARDVAHVLAAACRAAPERTALVGRDRRYTYAELDAEADAAARALAELGVTRGDRVAACLPNDTAVVVAFHATMRLGAVWVGLNQLLAPRERTTLLRDAGARLLIADPDVAAAVRADRANLPALRHVLVAAGPGNSGPGNSGPGDSGHAVPVTAGDAAPGTEASWAELVAARRGERPPARNVDPDAPAAIAYTSGTTSAPKGVVHCQAGLVVPGAAIVASRGYGPDLRKGDCLALTILNLLVLSTVLVAQAQGTCVVMDARDARSIARWIRDEQVTVWNGVPTMLYDLVHEPTVTRQDLASLCDVWSGGAPCPGTVQAAFRERFGHRVHTTYGLTEAPTVVAIEGRATSGPPGSSGQSLPHLEVTVRDDAGRQIPVGQTGEICCGPPADPAWAGRHRSMLGYRHRPAATAAALRDGVLHTGDVGYLDAEGNLFVQDRKQLVILRGGANVYPAEVEDVLMAMPGVRGCVVVGRPDERLGEQTVAVLEIDPADDPADEAGGGTGPAVPPAGAREAAWRADCRERLARYKVPDRFFVWPSLPRNAMGKVRRDVVKEAVGGGAP